MNRRFVSALPSLVVLVLGIVLVMALETATEWPYLQRAGVIAAYYGIGIAALKRLELWDPIRLGNGSLLRVLAVASLLSLLVMAVSALGGFSSVHPPSDSNQAHDTVE